MQTQCLAVLVHQPAQSDWVAIVAHRLHHRWHTAEPEQLEELARELWLDDRLRDLKPAKAAEQWLSPISSR